jgi:phage pi2 protein 07
MKHSVGDKVKIREDLVAEIIYGKEKFVSRMEEYRGCEATIVDAFHRNGGDLYLIDIDDKCWYWTDEMFEEEHVSKFNVGDKVRLRRDLEVNKIYNGLTLYSAMNSKYHDIIMTIEKCADDNYMCEESGYWWGEDMLEKVEENVGMTVEDLLNHTDVEQGGLIITVYYPNAYFEATIGHNKINRNSELYKRFIKAYGDMIVDEVSFDIRNDNMVVMLIKVDYCD